MEDNTQTAPARRAIDDLQWDPYLSLRKLCEYSGLSIRTLRTQLTHVTHPLPHYRVGGKILVKRSEFDSWIHTFRHSDQRSSRELVSSLLRSL